MRAFINQIKTSNPTFGSKGQGRTALTYTINANTSIASLSPQGMPGYVSGKTDVTIVVNAGIYVWSNITSTPALTLGAINSGDTVTLINNGYIMGQGGTGTSGVGGPALSLGSATTIDNTNASAYIGGGGGGGNSTYGWVCCVGGITTGGGGGAGGGAGGGGYAAGPSFAGGAGGAIGVVGDNGSGNYGSNSGGGGGRIFPGTGGAGGGIGTPGIGGGAGGGSGGSFYFGVGSAGGAASAASAGPGGGGWGASGSGAGGKAVALNAFAVTWVSGNTTRVYGAVS